MINDIWFEKCNDYFNKASDTKLVDPTQDEYAGNLKKKTPLSCEIRGSFLPHQN